MDETVDFLMDYVGRKNLAPISMTAAPPQSGELTPSKPAHPTEAAAVRSGSGDCTTLELNSTSANPVTSQTQPTVTA